ncbi:hypothetical protein PLESTF_001030000 [Pleodorina starrii]|nr:hypothetical protein PLESTF_001030000 [Pleodorina starrii]
MEQVQELTMQRSSLRASSSGLSNVTNAAHEPPSWSDTSSSDASASSAALAPDGVTPAQLDYMRRHLEPGSCQADEATLKRFIRATGGNLALSAKRLNATLAWRSKVQPEKVVCRACARDPRSHYMHCCGFCQRGRPIIYSCLELPTNKVFDDNRDHMIQTFETAVKLMPPGVEQWIWVCDFKGFGMADVNPKLAKLFLDISAEHYPERLGLFLVVDAPSLFGLLWKAISHFVDPKTYKKIRFLPFDAGKGDVLSKSKLKGEMDLHFDPLTTAWLIREMNENRDKAKVQGANKKVYNTYSLYEQALEGQLCDGHEHKSCHHGHLAQPQAAAKQPTAPAAPPSADPQPPSSAAAAAAAAAAAVHARSGSAAGAAAAAYEAAAAELGPVHNLLGTPALLHVLNTNPELLLPQATATA